MRGCRRGGRFTKRPYRGRGVPTVAAVFLWGPAEAVTYPYNR